MINRTPFAPAWLFRGSVLADGLLLDEALVGRDEVRRRVFALWAPGARLCRAEGDWVLVWPTPRRLQAEEAPGLPLVRSERCFVAAPLAPAAVSGPPAAGECVLVIRGGIVGVLPLGPDEDPSEWIDLGPGEVLKTRRVGGDCVRPLPDPSPPVSDPVLAPSIGMPPEERAALLSALSQPPPKSAPVAGPRAPRPLPGLRLAARSVLPSLRASVAGR